MTSFMAEVTSVTGYGENRLWTITRINDLLLDALARGDDATAWAELYRTVDALLRDALRNDEPRDERAVAYLRAFLRENDDLAGA